MEMMEESVSVIFFKNKTFKEFIKKFNMKKE